MKIRFIKPFRFIGNAPDDGSDSEVPVGCVVDLENDESARWLIDNGFAERATYRWLYDSGEYYTLGAYCVVSIGWGHSEVDEFRRDCGLAFKTDELAQRFVDYLKAVEIVRHDEGFMKPTLKDNNGVSLGFGIFLTPDGVAVIPPTARSVHAGEFYFDTKEHARDSRNAHPSEWQTILDYDWSKE